jgi:hypothetical protein
MAYRKAQGPVEAEMTLFGACNVSVANRRFWQREGRGPRHCNELPRTHWAG